MQNSRPKLAPADDEALDALGVRRPHLLAAWEQLRDEGQPVPAMVWAGLGRWESGDLIERARAAGVCLPGFVAAEHLPALYRCAEALAYPSLYEGFGLPPLEAMACGTPVLSAYSTSLPEAVGDAAVTVDPTEVAALAEGLARAAGFRWEGTARRLLAVLGEET